MPHVPHQPRQLHAGRDAATHDRDLGVEVWPKEHICARGMGMGVSELLADVEPPVRAALLRLAALHRVTDARTFLLRLRTWDACEPGVVWRLRRAYNARHAPADRLWVPLVG